MSIMILFCWLVISHCSLALSKQTAYDASGKREVLSLPFAHRSAQLAFGYGRPKRDSQDVGIPVPVDGRDREDTRGCSTGAVYCGHELLRIWPWPLSLSEHSNNDLYQCDGPRTVNKIEACDDGCVRAPRSYCRWRPRACLSGFEYCGHKLRQLFNDSTHYNEHDLYRCHSNGLKGVHVASCAWKCVGGLIPRCTKAACTRGSRHCGDVLNEYMFSPNYLKPDSIYECGLSLIGGVYDSDESNWRTLSEIRQCTLYSCTSRRGFAGCIPPNTCSTEPFPPVCDNQIMEDSNGSKIDPGDFERRSQLLFFCKDGSRYGRRCLLNSFCDSSPETARCVDECEEGVNYCGHELQEKGWRADAYASNSIFRCSNRMKAEKVSTCDGSCKRKDKRVFCEAACVADRSYCGHELDDPQESLSRIYIPSAIYRCEPNSSARWFVKPCRGLCLNGECLPNCEPGSTSCGQALLDRNFTAAAPGHLYRCSSDGASIVLEQECQRECVSQGGPSYCSNACKFNVVYCGNSKQLTRWPHLLPHARYACKGDDIEPKLLSSCSNECIKTRDGYARCRRECDIDTAYCGFQLLELGFGERENVDPQQRNALYRCGSDNRLTIEQRCAAQCLYTTHARCIRECRPGMKYCGHELRELGFADVSEGSLYKCDNATSVIRVEACVPSRCTAETEESGLSSHCAPSVQRSPQASHCGVQSPGRHKRLIMLPTIYNGENTPREEWPWMVSLRDRANGHFCGGVLIRRDWVLTAAHCVKDERKLASVVLGDYQIHKHDKAETRMRPKQIILHNRHNTFSSGDIALIQLVPSVAYGSHIRPICLPTNSSASADPTPANTACKITGWGVYDSTRRLASKLQTGDAQIRTAAECIERNDSFSEEVGICTGREHGSTTATICKGDSGGPLQCEMPDGSWVVYGIASHAASNSCSDVGSDTQFFAFFTRVSRFVEWIKETVDAVASPANDSQMEPAIVTEPQLADYEPDDS